MYRTEIRMLEFIEKECTQTRVIFVTSSSFLHDAIANSSYLSCSRRTTRWVRAIYVFIRSRCTILNISSIEKGKNKSGSPIFSHEVAVIKLLNRKNEDRKILKGREREFRAASFSKTFFNNNPRKLFNTKQNKKTSIDVKVLSFCNVT